MVERPQLPPFDEFLSSLASSSGFTPNNRTPPTVPPRTHREIVGIPRETRHPQASYAPSNNRAGSSRSPDGFSSSQPAHILRRATWHEYGGGLPTRTTPPRAPPETLPRPKMTTDPGTRKGKRPSSHEIASRTDVRNRIEPVETTDSDIVVESPSDSGSEHRQSTTDSRQSSGHRPNREQRRIIPLDEHGSPELVRSPPLATPGKTKRGSMANTKRKRSPSPARISGTKSRKVSKSRKCATKRRRIASTSSHTSPPWEELVRILDEFPDNIEELGAWQENVVANAEQIAPDPATQPNAVQKATQKMVFDDITRYPDNIWLAILGLKIKRSKTQVANWFANGRQNARVKMQRKNFKRVKDQYLTERDIVLYQKAIDKLGDKWSDNIFLEEVKRFLGQSLQSARRS